jgi:hypothetical protein
MNSVQTFRYKDLGKYETAERWLPSLFVRGFQATATYHNEGDGVTVTAFLCNKIITLFFWK